MSRLTEKEICMMKLEILNMERKNLRSKAKTDQRMSEEIQKIIIEYSKMKK